MDYSNYNARKEGKYGDIWPNTGKCVFCDLRKKYLIHETDKAVLTVNLFPYIDGHLLVIPKRHVEDYLDLDKSEWEDMYGLAQLGIKLLRSRLGIEELWFLLRAPGGLKAQKTVPHLHMLILPYKEGIVSWHFQKITFPPLELAALLRKHKDEIN